MDKPCWIICSSYIDIIWRPCHFCHLCQLRSSHCQSNIILPAPIYIYHIFGSSRILYSYFIYSAFSMWVNRISSSRCLWWIRLAIFRDSLDFLLPEFSAPHWGKRRNSIDNQLIVFYKKVKCISTVSSGLNSLAAICLEDFVRPFCCLGMSDARATNISKGLAVIFGLLCFGLVFAAAQLGNVLEVNEILKLVLLIAKIRLYLTYNISRPL